MSKGQYPVAQNGVIHGHDVYIVGRGWVYQPLPKPVAWVEVDHGK